VDENQVLVVETLKVKNMVRNRKLSKSIHDAGWSSFVSMLDYKSEKVGKVLIKVDPFFASSKICNCCGHKKDKLELSEREWTCSDCDSINHRDINAAKNIRDEGIRILKKRTDGASGLVCGDGVRLWFAEATVWETEKVC
jgi:putative transposase